MAQEKEKRSPQRTIRLGSVGPEPMDLELAQAFSDAVLSLVEQNCRCPSCEFVRLLVRKRREIFRGGAGGP